MKTLKFDRLFGAVMADPPWAYATYSRKGKGRSQEAYYDVMDLPAIKAMPVGQLCKPDAVLFLWIHNSMVPQGLEVMRAWGFEYKSAGFFWLKIYGSDLLGARIRMGMGKWTRYGGEMCYIGTRGNPSPLSHSVRQVIQAPTREPSRKPDEIYDGIEALCPGPYLELFASTEAQPRKGWVRWIGKAPFPERRWKSNEYPGEDDGASVQPD